MLRSQILLLTVLTCLSSHVLADDYKPRVAEASNDAQLALQGFVLPKGMQGSLLASEPALANPVAFYVANDGRVYVCETFRQEVGVEDNRGHMNWLNNDLRLETVEERLAMFKKYLGADVNKYAAEQDRIRVLKDTNGDGVFDEDKIFAEGFNDILDGTGAGVIEHDGKVYYTCIPKLWMLEDTDADGIADKTDALHHGYGVRVAFRGHDMHGLTVGPDGRLYYSIGDRGYNVITKEGTRLKRVDNGAVFRCYMDGSNLEVFAYGLRNPQELAFDDHGNLWTGDNNSDGGDKARWVYIVQDGDTGWRMHYQYLEDRGPWNREHMWYPYRIDEETSVVQPAYIVPPVANLADGPSGLTYYPGIGLSERYANHFFMADFRGGAGNSGIRSFSVEPKGATFELTDSHKFIWSILGTDVDFAPDGSLYVTDWVNGWVGEGKGRLYRFADQENISAVAGANVPQLLNGGVAKSDTEELFTLLSHADRRIRQMAQFELVKRELREELFAAVKAASGDTVAQRHLAWALWQLGLKSADDAKRVIEFCAAGGIKSADDLGVQYIKIMTDLIKRHGISDAMTAETRSTLQDELVSLTKSRELREAGFAAVALGAIGTGSDTAILLELLERNDNKDPVLRHQAVMGLAKLWERIPQTVVTEGLAARSAAARLGVVVALRYLKRDEVALLLSDPDPAVAAEVARAIHEQGGSNALNALAFPLLLGTSNPKGITDPVIVRRALEACYRLGNMRHALAVARVAGDATRPEELRLVATKMLATWNNTEQLDTVDGRWRPLPKREVEGLDEAVKKDLPGMLAGPKAVRDSAVALAAQLEIKDVVPTLQQMLADTKSDETTRVSAFKALSTLSDDIDRLLADGSADESEAVRIAALELLAQSRPEDAVAELLTAVEKGSLKAQQRSLFLLGQIKSATSIAALTKTFDALNTGSLPAAAILDLLNAAESTGDSTLQASVAAYRAANAKDGDKVSEWSECMEGGDLENGKTIFFGRASASCRRCHKVNGNGADVGPDLSAVAKDKDRRYLLEAIVDPNAKIAKDFETTIIVDFDGRIHSGIIKEETDKFVKLMTPQGAIITVALDEIDERAKGQSGMPADIAKNLSRDDVRDLVEYLSSLKVAADGAHGNAGE